MTYDKQKIPTSPDWISDYGKLEWKRLITEMEEKNLVGTFDLNIFAMYCDALGNYRKCSEDVIKRGAVVKSKNGMPLENPNSYLMERHRKAFVSLAVQLGLTPKSKIKGTTKAKMSMLDSLKIKAKNG
jgi:P27 family predicted phage terminase small subunit